MQNYNYTTDYYSDYFLDDSCFGLDGAANLYECYWSQSAVKPVVAPETAKTAPKELLGTEGDDCIIVESEEENPVRKPEPKPEEKPQPKPEDKTPNPAVAADKELDAPVLAEVPVDTKAETSGEPAPAKTAEHRVKATEPGVSIQEEREAGYLSFTNANNESEMVQASVAYLALMNNTRNTKATTTDIENERAAKEWLRSDGAKLALSDWQKAAASQAMSPAERNVKALQYLEAVTSAYTDEEIQKDPALRKNVQWAQQYRTFLGENTACQLNLDELRAKNNGTLTHEIIAQAAGEKLGFTPQEMEAFYKANPGGSANANNRFATSADKNIPDSKWADTLKNEKEIVIWARNMTEFQERKNWLQNYRKEAAQVAAEKARIEEASKPPINDTRSLTIPSDAQIKPINDSMLERAQYEIGLLIRENCPGIASLDTPEGIQTDAARSFTAGLAKSATLGIVDVGEVRANSDKRAGLVAASNIVGQFVGALVPYATAGKVLQVGSKIPQVAKAIETLREAGTLGQVVERATQTGLQFGSVAAAREAVSVAKREHTLAVGVRNTVLETAGGATVGAIVGPGAGIVESSLKTSAVMVPINEIEHGAHAPVAVTGNRLFDAILFDVSVNAITHSMHARKAEDGGATTKVDEVAPVPAEKPVAKPAAKAESPLKIEEYESGRTEYYSDREVEIQNLPNQDELQVSRYKDGSVTTRTIPHPGKQRPIVEELQRDGDGSEALPIARETYPEGTVTEYFKNDMARITRPDQMQLLLNKGEVVQVVSPSGNVWRRGTDGKFRNAEGTVIDKIKDVKAAPDGTVEFNFTDGRWRSVGARIGAVDLNGTAHPTTMNGAEQFRWKPSEHLLRKHEEWAGEVSRDKARVDSQILDDTVGGVLDKHFGAEKNLNVLELGPSNTTVVPDRLKGNFQNYTAVDIAPTYLKQQREFMLGDGHDPAKVSHVTGDIYDLPMAAGKQDVVVAMHNNAFVPHSSGDINVTRAIDQVALALKAGGKFVVGRWNMGDEAATRHLLNRFKIVEAIPEGPGYPGQYKCLVLERKPDAEMPVARPVAAN